MSLLPFFNTKKDANKFLVVEIGDTQVRTLAFYYEGVGKLKIIGSAVREFKDGAVSNNHILDKEDVALTVRECATAATEELGDVIKDVIVGVKGTSCIEITTTAKSTATNKRSITEKDINEVYGRIIEAAYTQAQNEAIQTTGNYDAKLEIIASSTVYHKLDGTFMENPVTSVGEILESAVFNAFCFSNELKVLKKVINKAGLSILAIAPVPYSLVQNITNMDIEETTDYTLINLGENMTEISIVFGKGLIDTKTLPIGYVHLYEGLSNKMGLTTREAKKVLKTYSSGQLKEDEAEVVQKCLEEVLEVWTEGVKVCFEDFTEIKTFANQIYLTGIGTTIPDVIDVLKEEPWYKNIPFRALPEYKKIDINDFANISDATGKVTSPMWVPVQSLGLIYLEMREQND